MTGNTIPSIEVDLDASPAKRWAVLHDYRQQARELCEHYLTDLGGLETIGELLPEYVARTVSPAHQAELAAIAACLDVDPSVIALTNLYYEAIKVIMGCTAFVVNGPQGPIHARNLDWWTQGEALAKYSLLLNYCRSGQLRYQVVGWPGYIGCLSGLAPGRFSITLNAVLSEEPPQLAQPVSLLIRQVLETAGNFDDAVRVLCHTPIASDCILVVAGTTRDQGCVIERTPQRFRLRKMTSNVVVATNDYRSDLAGSSTAPGLLSETACSRLDRMTELVNGRALSVDVAGHLLDDPDVFMPNMTVQQIAFVPATGQLIATHTAQGA